MGKLTVRYQSSGLTYKGQAPFIWKEFRLFRKLYTSIALLPWSMVILVSLLPGTKINIRSLSLLFPSFSPSISSSHYHYVWLTTRVDLAGDIVFSFFFLDCANKVQHRNSSVPGLFTFIGSRYYSCKATGRVRYYWVVNKTRLSRSNPTTV
jgi:hypothetical protein